MSDLKKTIKTVEMGFRNSIIYKYNFLIGFFSGIFSVVVQLVFWPIYYNAGADLSYSAIEEVTISGYYLEEMMTYSVLIYFIQKGTSMMDISNIIRDDIKEGTLNMQLIRPVSYLWSKWLFLFSNQVSYNLLSFVFMTVLAFFMKNFFVLPKNFIQISLVVLFLFGACILSFLINCIIGLLSFWLLETQALSVLLNMTITILSGAIFPIDLINNEFKYFLQILPFSYIGFIPTQVYLNKMSGEKIGISALICFSWIIVFIVLVDKLWERGMRRYSAFGG